MISDMIADRRYDCALAAALTILNEIDAYPALPKHEKLALAVFSILHAMRQCDEEKQPLAFGLN